MDNKEKVIEANASGKEANLVNGWLGFLIMEDVYLTKSREKHYVETVKILSLPNFFVGEHSKMSYFMVR